MNGDVLNPVTTQDAILVVNTGPSPCRPGTFNNEAEEVKMVLSIAETIFLSIAETIFIDRRDNLVT